MTCVAGIAQSGRCYLCGDSAASAGDDRWTMGRKVRRIGGIVLGVAGDVALCGPILSGRWSPRWDGRAPRAWIGDEWVPAMRERLRRRRGDLTALLGVGGELWVVDRDGSIVAPPATSYTAIGSGAAWAVGALAALDGSRPRLAPRTRLRRALAIAARHSGGVAEPWAWASA